MFPFLPQSRLPSTCMPYGAPCKLTLILTSFGASFFTSLSNRSPKPVNTRLAEPRAHI